ncbi:MAG TPA: guanylate kinase [Clostridiales bacterium]|jgi:guanylate kinase|nr:guanylate kinase [Clostridiales bacterium]
MEKGKLFVISGPSGAGKGTICNELIKQSNVALSVSMTTRPPRRGEIEGQSYYFVTEERFVEEIGRDGFLEHASIFGNYYGTPKQAVYEYLEKGRDVILEIDVQGAMQVRRSCPDAIFIFVLPPDLDELAFRMTGRGTESPEQMSRRLEQACVEIARVVDYNYFIVNDKLQDAVESILAIIRAEHSRVTDTIVSRIAAYGMASGCSEN